MYIHIFKKTIGFRWIKDLNIKSKVKLFRENDLYKFWIKKLSKKQKRRNKTKPKIT